MIYCTLKLNLFPCFYLIYSDCSIESPLVVDSESATYNSSGTIGCPEGNTLFYSNGTRPTSTQTTCLATAEWSECDGLECRQGLFSEKNISSFSAVCCKQKKITLNRSSTIENDTGSKAELTNRLGMLKPNGLVEMRGLVTNNEDRFLGD